MCFGTIPVSMKVCEDCLRMAGTRKNSSVPARWASRKDAILFLRFAMYGRHPTADEHLADMKQSDYYREDVDARELVFRC